MSFLGSLLGMLALTSAHYTWRAISDAGAVMLIGSFGATAVLVYGSPTAPLSQPRNVLGGHLLSACVGVALRQLLLELPGWEGGVFLVAALAVSLSILAMSAAGVLHPPGGATALIAVTGDASIRALGWWFTLAPALAGATILLLVALLVNNLPGSGRVYPQHW